MVTKKPNDEKGTNARVQTKIHTFQISEFFFEMHINKRNAERKQALYEATTVAVKRSIQVL